MAPASSWLRCPIDHDPLAREGQMWSCQHCARRYPTLAGIPCVFSDTTQVLQRWRVLVELFARSNQRAHDEVLAELANEHASPKTRARLERFRALLPLHGERVLELMQSAGIEPYGQPVGETSSSERWLMSYWAHIHRDWAWEASGSRENAAALDACLEVLPHGRDTALGRVLVLGAGACRLPYDLHRATRTKTTVALDVHPLGLLVAKRLIEGETLQLFEPLSHPNLGEDVMVERTLAAPQPGITGFSFLLADGLDPPIADGSFDTVLTPWFIDQIPTDLVKLLPMIHRVLAPTGRWLNHGPLLYNPKHTSLRHRYRTDEVLDIVERAGFSIEAHTSRRMLYLECPEDTQGRTEMVLTFAARRGDQPPVLGEPTPTWVVDADVPIPRLSGLEHYAAPHPMFAVVARLIDGRRTAKDIAQILIANHKVPAHAATGGVQACLREIWRTVGGSATA